MTLVAMFLVMWQVNPTLTLLATAVLPDMVVVFRAYAKPMLDESYRQQEFEGRIYTKRRRDVFRTRRGAGVWPGRLE